MTKFQGEVKEAINVHKNFQQMEESVDSLKKELEKTGTEKNVLQETVELANEKNA